jgi:hypothetical protein
MLVEEHCEKIPDDIVRERLNQMILIERYRTVRR